LRVPSLGVELLWIPAAEGGDSFQVVRRGWGKLRGEGFVGDLSGAWVVEEVDVVKLLVELDPLQGSKEECDDEEWPAGS
jgi:hypothetical protein